MFLSAIAKVMSPIVAVFYKEKNYEAVEYITRKSIRQVLIISIPICILFAVYPEIFAIMFTLDDPAEIRVICTALRITSIGLIGRSLSLLLSNYAQAIEKNRLASAMNLLEECIVAFCGGILLTHMFGAIGIWYALVIADVVPLILYASLSILYQKKNKDKIKAMLLLHETSTLTWTHIRGNNDINSYIDDNKKGLISKLGNNINVETLNLIEDIVMNIFKDEELKSIDVTIKIGDDVVSLIFTYEGKLINPVTDEYTGKINGDIEYSPILGFNRTYINVAI